MVCICVSVIASMCVCVYMCVCASYFVENLGNSEASEWQLALNDQGVAKVGQCGQWAAIGSGTSGHQTTELSICLSDLVNALKDNFAGFWPNLVKEASC